MKGQEQTSRRWAEREVGLKGWVGQKDKGKGISFIFRIYFGKK
jgi:hypothetical protein